MTAQHEYRGMRSRLCQAAGRSWWQASSVNMTPTSSSMAVAPQDHLGGPRAAQRDLSAGWRRCLGHPTGRVA
jgi:hypothetical protein